MQPQAIEALFTHPDGRFGFARWGRPIVPVVFGVQDATLATIKGTIEATVAIAGHKMAAADPETGANFLLFFVRDWGELADAPQLRDLVDDPAALAVRLQAAGATQYRRFRFDAGGAIIACFTFVRIDGVTADLPADHIGLGVAVQAMLTWAERAFAHDAAVALLPDGQGSIIRPDIAHILRAAYDPALPDTAADPAFALRLFARVQA